MNNIDTERTTEEGGAGRQGRSLLLIGTLLSAVMVIGGYVLFLAPKSDAVAPDRAASPWPGWPARGRHRPSAAAADVGPGERRATGNVV